MEERLEFMEEWMDWLLFILLSCNTLEEFVEKQLNEFLCRTAGSAVETTRVIHRRMNSFSNTYFINIESGINFESDFVDLLSGTSVTIHQKSLSKFLDE